MIIPITSKNSIKMFTNSKVYRATEDRQLDVLKCLHEQGHPLHKECCFIAAAKEYLEILKYLHEQGCPWDRECCVFASEGGHLEVLKYLHQQGCLLSRGCLIVAQDQEIIDYINQHQMCH